MLSPGMPMNLREEPGTRLSKAEQTRVLRLKKRLSWLRARTAINPQLSHDRAEASALAWALTQLQAAYPEIGQIEYLGEDTLLARPDEQAALETAAEESANT